MDGIERIKVLASEIKDKAILNIVDYLLSREDMNEKYLNEEKSLKQMVSYIKKEAHKQAQDGMAMVEDKEVYGWAIHYFDETNEDLGFIQKQIKNEPKSTDEESKKEVKLVEEKESGVVKEPTKSTRWIPEGQISLFDL